MITKSILVTGCNRGLGLELIKQLASHQNTPWCIFAACRNPNEAQDLHHIADMHSNVHLLEIDATNHETIVQAEEEIAEYVQDDGLNVLFNNAGQIQGNEMRIKNVDVDNLRRLIEVNTITPLVMAQTFLPLVRKASLLRKPSKEMNVSRAAILNMCGIAASFGGNIYGGKYSYRMSKVGMNIMGQNLGMELKRDRILSVNIHPGWVKTDLGGKTAPLDKEDSIKQLIETLPQLNEAHTGTHWDTFHNKQLPW